jgi:hypothetical protein
MMHVAESGIFKYLLNVFIDSMPNATKAKVDALVEKLFVPIRSTKKSDFPRMNFKGGATSLTMLSSHHWPGMMLAFFMMLLTPKGREVCKDCFQKEDMEIPDVNWKDEGCTQVRHEPTSCSRNIARRWPRGNSTTGYRVTF